MILRVFPERTNATPTDDFVRIGGQPHLLDPDPRVAEVHVSVTFTWHREQAKRIFDFYEWLYPDVPVKLGGPAYGDPGGEFAPGRYLKPGHLITSRGCPNRCVRCFVPRREGELRELEIHDGWSVHDNNLLACSLEHQERVFEMLARQKQRPCFKGGLEAARITKEIARQLREIRTERLYVAYDRPSQLDSVKVAGAILQDAGFTYHHLNCYVLAGFDGDTLGAATERCRQVYEAGFIPFAMVFRNEAGDAPGPEWLEWQKNYVRPARTKAVLKSKTPKGDRSRD